MGHTENLRIFGRCPAGVSCLGHLVGGGGSLIAGVILGRDLDLDLLAHIRLLGGDVGLFRFALDEGRSGAVHTVPLVGQAGDITGQTGGIRRQRIVDLSRAGNCDLDAQLILALSLWDLGIKFQ